MEKIFLIKSLCQKRKNKTTIAYYQKSMVFMCFNFKSNDWISQNETTMQTKCHETQILRIINNSYISYAVIVEYFIFNSSPVLQLRKQGNRNKFNKYVMRP